MKVNEFLLVIALISGASILEGRKHYAKFYSSKKRKQ